MTLTKTKTLVYIRYMIIQKKLFLQSYQRQFKPMFTYDQNRHYVTTDLLRWVLRFSSLKLLILQRVCSLNEIIVFMFEGQYYKLLYMFYSKFFFLKLCYKSTSVIFALLQIKAFGIIHIIHM